MKILDLIQQGSPEWLAARAAHYCASDAPSMIGLSKYKSRTELLREKKTGVAKEVDASTQALFDRGHAAEEAARPEASKLIGSSLSPKVCTEIIDGMPLLASLDGVTENWGCIWEHKLYAQWIADYINENMDLPDTHWPQVEHQMLVSGATEALFMTSNGDQSACVWYESQPERRARVIAGWKQFEKDLETFVVEDEKPEVIAVPTEALPAVYVQLDGSISIRDNLDAFGEQLRRYIDSMNMKPETDQDFADTEAAIKVLGKAEDAIANASACAIEQASSLAAMQRKSDFLKDLARTTRLALEKLLKREKEARKNALLGEAEQDFRSHIEGLNASFGMTLMSAGNAAAEFAASIKGMRSLDGMKDTAKTLLSQMKVSADLKAEAINKNLNLIHANEKFGFLFNDIRSIATLPCNEFSEIVSARIAKHEDAEQKRIAEERERIQNEERARAEAAAQATAEAERERIRAEERAIAEAEAAAKRSAPSEKEALPPAPPAPEPSPELAKVETVAPAGTEASNDEGEATITLGEIGKRLGFNLPASVVEDLGIHSVGRARAAVLFRASDFPRLCAALIEKIRAASADSIKKAA